MGLLAKLEAAGAEKQFTALADRVAAHAAPGDLYDLVRLVMRAEGTGEQLTVVAGRATTHIPLNYPTAVAWLLDTLREAGAQEQFAVLADRAATNVSLDSARRRAPAGCVAGGGGAAAVRRPG